MPTGNTNRVLSEFELPVKTTALVPAARLSSEVRNHRNDIPKSKWVETEFVPAPAMIRRDIHSRNVRRTAPHLDQHTNPDKNFMISGCRPQTTTERSKSWMPQARNLEAIINCGGPNLPALLPRHALSAKVEKSAEINGHENFFPGKSFPLPVERALDTEKLPLKKYRPSHFELSLFLRKTRHRTYGHSSIDWNSFSTKIDKRTSREVHSIAVAKKELPASAAADLVSERSSIPSPEFSIPPEFKKIIALNGCSDKQNELLQSQFKKTLDHRLRSLMEEQRSFLRQQEKAHATEVTKLKETFEKKMQASIENMKKDQKKLQNEKTYKIVNMKNWLDLQKRSYKLPPTP